MNTFLIILFSCLGAVSTYLFALKTKQSPVLSSSLVSLIVACFLWSLLPIIGETTIRTLALVFFGGSFVGMSADKVIKSTANVFGAGLIFGIIYVLTTKLFVGYGGGLGFKASLSVLTAVGLSLCVQQVICFIQKK